MSEPAQNDGVYVTVQQLNQLRSAARGYSLLPGQPARSVLTGKHGSRLRGRGLNFEELRQYFPGDDVRTIDWHVTARTRKPYIRVYSEERDRPLLLIVDQRPGMFFGSRRAMKSVAAAEAAALAAWRSLSVGDRVGGIVIGPAGLVEIRPHRSESRVRQLLGAIADANQQLRADSTSTVTLNQALERAARLVPHDGLVCVISDLSDADQESIRHMTTLQAHNDVFMAFVFDPLEGEIPAAGRLVAAAGTQRLEFDSSSRGLRDRYRDEFEKRLARLKDLSARRQVPWLAISAADDVVHQLREGLGGVASRRGRPK